jgi:hypothetical protein
LAKVHQGLQFWVQVEWGRPVLPEQFFTMQKSQHSTTNIDILLVVILQPTK